MAAPILLCCYENISPTKAFRALVVFICSFFSVFFYLFASEFTKWYTVLWVSFLVAFVFTIGVLVNVYLRCAAFLFFVHMFFSRFGLLMLFISGSWMTIQTGLGAQRRNQVLQNQYLLEIEEDDVTNPHLNSLDYLLGILHYASLIPYFCIYVYSVLYEVTYECRRIARRSQESSHGNMYYMCKSLFKYVVLLVVGGFFVTTFIVYSHQWHNYQNIVSQFQSKKLNPSVLVECPFRWIIFYGVFSGVIGVLSFFSHYMIKFRKPIIRKHFSFTKSNVLPKKRNFYMAKDDDDVPKPKKATKHKNRKSSHVKRNVRHVEHDSSNEVDTQRNSAIVVSSSSDSDSNSITRNSRKPCVSLRNESVKYYTKRERKYPGTAVRVSEIIDDEEGNISMSGKKSRQTQSTYSPNYELPMTTRKVIFDTSGSDTENE